MKIITEGFALPIEKALVRILEKELSKVDCKDSQSIILNFRDLTYSATTGGYHPVEFMLNQQGIIQYITDFAYVGSGEMAELAKELDFDFSNGLLEQMGHSYPIENAWELFPVWQQNFCAYYSSNVFNVEVSQY